MPLSSKSAAILLVVCFSLALATYVGRSPVGDDAWFAEQSYRFLKDGIIRSDFFAGFNFWEDQILVSHKLFLWFGAGMMSWFGIDSFVSQLSGFLFFVILVLQMTWYVYRRENRKWTILITYVLILIFANRLLVRLSFENRPEMMLTSLGLASFLLLNRPTQLGIWISVSGLLAGLAVCVHLNGIIYVIAGTVTLLLTRQFRYPGIFFIAAAFSASLYFIDILARPDGLEFWWRQFSSDPEAGKGLDAKTKLIQLVSYPNMFVFSPEQCALTLLFLYVLWKLRKNLSGIPRNLRVYSLAMLISFWFLSKGNAPNYMVLFVPWMLIIIYELYRENPFRDRGLKLVLLGYFVIGWFGMLQLIYKNYKTGSIPETYSSIAEILPKTGVGLVPLQFFFNEYPRFSKLLAHENYKLRHGKRNLSAIRMFNWAERNGVNFIVLDYGYLKEGYYPAAGTRELGEYNLRYFDGRIGVYFRRAGRRM